MERARRQRTSLLTRFGITSLVLLVGLGVVLVAAVVVPVAGRARRKAADVARVVALAGQLRPSDFATGFAPLPADRTGGLDQTYRPLTAADVVFRVKVWNDQHWIVYADEAKLRGRWFAPDSELSDALQGSVSTSIAPPDQAENVGDRGRFAELAQVYLPVRFDAAGLLTEDAARPVVGAFEIYIGYDPIIDAEWARAWHLALIIVVGLTVLYLALFRLVASASSRLRRQAEANRHQATHDALTGLPNRTQFTDRLDQAVAASLAVGRRAAVLLVDLDRFKEINDTLGHGSGDVVLTTLADRLRTGFRDDDTVARLGGDEFALVVPGIDTDDRALAVAAKLRALLAEPVALEDGLSIEVHGSVGVAFAPDHGGAAELLLQRADVAMYAAKRAHTGVEVYRGALDHYSPLRLQLAGEVRDAVDGGQLFLAYSRRSTCAPARWWASRRWCAGATRRAASCRPATGCPRWRTPSWRTRSPCTSSTWPWPPAGAGTTAAWGCTWR